MDSAVATFRALHQEGCFLLPNPWDAGSAVFLQQMGFPALATTSAGFAFSQGLPDAGVPRDRMLRHIREIVAATPLPVNADFQGAYADDPEQVAINVTLCVRTGAAGVSVEDSTPDGTGLYERDLAVERIRAARAAIDTSRTGAVLTARCEAFLAGAEKARETVLDRLTAFAEAGADCLYAPGVKDAATVSEIVKAVAPKPVNVLAGGPYFTVEQLKALGVRRISVGGALARAAWGGFQRAAKEMLEKGTFTEFASGTPFADLESLFKTRQKREA